VAVTCEESRRWIRAMTKLRKVQADLFLLTDQSVYTSEAAVMVGQSSVGSQVPGRRASLSPSRSNDCHAVPRPVN
jgi:hypothetical protein